MTRSNRTLVFHASVALILTAALAGGLLALVRPALHWYVFLAAWLAAVNVITLAYYAFDKARAGTGAGRIPEVVLHGLAALGGSGGAYLGMVLFRHKTIKSRFRIFFWMIVVFQILLVAALVYRILKGRDW